MIALFIIAVIVAFVVLCFAMADISHRSDEDAERAFREWLKEREDAD